MGNYILYRTVDFTVTGAPYTDPATNQVVTPAPVVADPKGKVILTQQIADPETVTVPEGFALAADPDGKYPIGTIYTPPA
ncbi:hypothetical protein HLH44_03535 [Gluconacetobacter sp. 1c LMG 22058]|uniref:Uncharacterized protein n=1 Tax=Gluconacetobacter dulcium TaxID=2729096 RepID=A0A7W4JXJ7_9PROT|nr:hypothetical protein [Gluconacetobacter dulcium]MBB2196543.1 hypothetical protein [Gluconacetobacter dulcium]